VVADKGVKAPPEQLTFHRPLGHHDLAQGDWVCTSTNEVHYLLVAREDPREAQIAARETKVLLDLACYVDPPILLKDGEFYRYVNVPGRPSRSVTLDDSKKKFNEAVKNLEAEHNASQKGKSKPAKFHTTLTEDDFRSTEVVDAEKALKELRRLNRERIQEQVPRSYRTQGGPLHDRPQVRVPWIPQGATELEARRTVYQRIATSALRGEGDNVPDPLRASHSSQLLGQVSSLTQQKVELEAALAADHLKMERLMAAVAAAEKQRDLAWLELNKLKSSGGSPGLKTSTPEPSGAVTPVPPPAPPPKGKAKGSTPPGKEVTPPAQAAPKPPEPVVMAVTPPQGIQGESNPTDSS